MFTPHRDQVSDSSRQHSEWPGEIVHQREGHKSHLSAEHIVVGYQYEHGEGYHGKLKTKQTEVTY